MKTKRSLIAVILIFSYFIGFSHYLIPHSEGLHELSSDNGNGTISTRLHQHHESSIADFKKEQKEHDHFQHSGHFDEGILDFIVCFLSKIEHSTSEDGQEIFFSDKDENRIAKNTLAKSPFLHVIVHTKLELKVLNRDINNWDFSIHYNAPPPCVLPNKGPPLFSC